MNLNSQIDYTKICFVVMNFGIKKIKRKKIDFDKIYEQVFEPAILEVTLPEGGKLIPIRTDKELLSGDIEVEMFQYLRNARFTFADITGLNPNVMYELGVRHATNQSRTAIFRQTKEVIPFDIKSIKAFPYEYEPETEIQKSKELIIKVLKDSLLQNRLDSPVQKVFMLQAKAENEKNVESILLDATNATRKEDFNTAITKYKQVLNIIPNDLNSLMALGLLLKTQARWQEAVETFKKSVDFLPEYSDGWRELGVAQNKVFHCAEDKKDLPVGSVALIKAIELNPLDFDAHASLGGIYKRDKNYTIASAMYEKANEISQGHPYPLLNYIVLKIRDKGIESLSTRDKLYLKRVELPLLKQIEDVPPYDSPWCFFNLSTVQLFKGDNAKALETLNKKLELAKDWEIRTHLETLKLIENQKDKINGLEEIIKLLQDTLS